MKAIATKDVWIIMDKDKQAIACGSPRDRRMCLTKNMNTGRILTYESEGKARAAFSGMNGFWDETHEVMPKSRYDYDRDKPTYLNKRYGKKKEGSGQFGKYTYWSNPDYEEMCIAVKAKITVEIDIDD